MLIFNRGIININKFWWTINDLFLNKHDFIDFVLEYDNTNKNIKNIFGINIQIINNIDDIKYILNNSPNKYKRGTIKYNFLKKMMKNNIGITYDTNQWMELRKQNEFVLSTQYIKSDILSELSDDIIKECNKIDKYDSFDSFKILAKNITKIILFGHTNITDKIFDLINTPNFFEMESNNQENYYDEWKNIFNNNEIKNPSLIDKFKNITNIYSEISIDQIPHWIFPIHNTIILTLPRLLKIDSYYDGNIPIRNKILEITRLYNQVVTLFRLDSETNKEYLIFIQMFLRNPKYFSNPHSYKPERWNDKNLEHEYYSLMFSQGPQICPGKNIIIHLLSILYENIKHKFYSPLNLDINDLPDTINPFTFFDK